MSRPILWRSPDGRKILNVLHVAYAVVMSDGSVSVYTPGDRALDDIHIPKEEAGLFLAALDAASVQPDTAKIDAIIDRLDSLRGDMGTVGGNELVMIVRDLAKAVRP